MARICKFNLNDKWPTYFALVGFALLIQVGNYLSKAVLIEDKLFTRYALLFNRWSLLLIATRYFYSLFVSLFSILVTFLLLACYLIFVSRNSSSQCYNLLIYYCISVRAKKIFFLLLIDLKRTIKFEKPKKNMPVIYKWHLQGLQHLRLFI